MPELTPALTVDEARRLMQRPTTLVVDVRTPGEFATGHLRGAVNIPADDVGPHLRRIVAAAGGTLLVVCQSGGRARRAAGLLGEGGVRDLAVLEGGMGSWLAAGGEVDRPAEDGRWTLERQIRLVAGSIVFVAILLSMLWPWTTWIAGFIGAGMTFAALTNTCLMGALLAKLPYNRAPSCDIDTALRRLRASSPDAIA